MPISSTSNFSVPSSAKFVIDKSPKPFGWGVVAPGYTVVNGKVVPSGSGVGVPSPSFFRSPDVRGSSVLQQAESARSNLTNIQIKKQILESKPSDIFSMKQMSINQDVSRVNSQAQALDREVANFNSKYSGKELTQSEYEQAVREASALEAKRSRLESESIKINKKIEAYNKEGVGQTELQKTREVLTPILNTETIYNTPLKEPSITSNTKNVRDLFINADSELIPTSSFATQNAKNFVSPKDVKFSSLPDLRTREEQLASSSQELAGQLEMSAVAGSALFAPFAIGALGGGLAATTVFGAGSGELIGGLSVISENRNASLGDITAGIAFGGATGAVLDYGLLKVTKILPKPKITFKNKDLFIIDEVLSKSKKINLPEPNLPNKINYLEEYGGKARIAGGLRIKDKFSNYDLQNLNLLSNKTTGVTVNTPVTIKSSKYLDEGKKRVIENNNNINIINSVINKERKPTKIYEILDNGLFQKTTLYDKDLKKVAINKIDLLSGGRKIINIGESGLKIKETIKPKKRFTIQKPVEAVRSETIEGLILKEAFVKQKNSNIKQREFKTITELLDIPKQKTIAINREPIKFNTKNPLSETFAVPELNKTTNLYGYKTNNKVNLPKPNLPKRESKILNEFKKLNIDERGSFQPRPVTLKKEYNEPIVVDDVWNNLTKVDDEVRVNGKNYLLENEYENAWNTLTNIEKDYKTSTLNRTRLNFPDVLKNKQIKNLKLNQTQPRILKNYEGIKLLQNEKLDIQDLTKVRLRDETQTRTQIRIRTDTKTKILSKTETLELQKLKTKTAEQPKTKLKLDELNKVKTKFKPKSLKLRVPFPRINLPKPKKENLVLESSFFGKGFIPFARVRGKEVALSKEALPYNLAVAKGSSFVKTTTARSFGLKQAGLTKIKDIAKQNLEQFRPRKLKSKIPEQVFIEKSRFAIDTPTEKQMLKQAKKRKSLKKWLRF